LATLTVKDLDDNNSYPLCWDNVIYGAKGLGYIFNQHESLGQIQEKKVITYYYSFSTADLKKSRKELLTKPESYWKELIISDLKIPHPDIENSIEEIDIQRIGHGMISPVPGFLFGNFRTEASRTIEDKIFFAHSDLSGISIFEEAFHQGINAVNKMLNETALD
ncbi:MAG: twin-arginine translocation pathway signal protein, partial [Flavobacteriaceae bacterium]